MIKYIDEELKNNFNLLNFLNLYCIGLKENKQFADKNYKNYIIDCCDPLHLKSISQGKDFQALNEPQ